MEKFIPIEKRSKKKQREIHAGRRGTWGGLNPVTRKPANPKAYSRKKARKWSDDSSMTVPFELLHIGARSLCFLSVPNEKEEDCSLSACVFNIYFAHIYFSGILPVSRKS